jgi:hypothetical protein
MDSMPSIGSLDMPAQCFECYTDNLVLTYTYGKFGCPDEHVQQM